MLGREVALDQRVRELPLRARELDPVPLETHGVGTALTQLLTLSGQSGDFLEQRLDGAAIVPAPES